MEYTWRCRADSLEIFDGAYGLPTWNSTLRTCSRRDGRREITSSGNLMRIRFVTDASRTRRGFKLYVKAGKAIILSS